MNDIRSDFKLDRNQEIYEEHVNTGASYNELAKKYDLSPQRISSIIKDVKDKGLNSKLITESPKEERERYKNLAVELREQGKLELALSMLDSVVSWDAANNNARGQVDALGHKKITLTLMADSSTDSSQKRQLLSQAVEIVEEALKIAESGDERLKGAVVTQKVQYASLLIKQSEFLDVKAKAEQLRKALETLDSCIKVFPGSEAHKAWPLAIKANALHELGRYDDSINTLHEAQKALFSGYDGEIKGADQAPMKLRVWNSGIMLGFSKIFADTNKPVLAEVYAMAVVQTPDPEGVLTARKKEAKAIIEKISQ